MLVGPRIQGRIWLVDHHKTFDVRLSANFSSRRAFLPSEPSSSHLISLVLRVIED